MSTTPRLSTLMAYLVRAGGKRLELGVDWHRPIWTGRPRVSHKDLAAVAALKAERYRMKRRARRA